MCHRGRRALAVSPHTPAWVISWGTPTPNQNPEPDMRLPLHAAAILMCVSLPAAAQDPVRFAPSTRATAQVNLMSTPEGAAERIIRIDYGQPHLRGRTLHTDSLVPYGALWRTGANATTTLHTDFMTMFGNNHLPAGRYAVFTMPARDGWQLILQKDEGQQAAEYDAAKDVARVPLRHRSLGTPVESFTILLIPAMSGLRGELRLLWGTEELSTEWTAM